MRGVRYDQAERARAALAAGVRRLRKRLEGDLGKEAGLRLVLGCSLVRQQSASGTGPTLDTADDVFARFATLAPTMPTWFGPLVAAGPNAALRQVWSALCADELAAAWDDEVILGWVFQFWNDPEREAIDGRVGPRGKVAGEEIAAKTQLFTERYMAEWLLDNSLGRLISGINGSSAGRGSLYVHAAAPACAEPVRLEELRVLDPACGTGHLLVVAFDLLLSAYRARARAQGDPIDDVRFAETIVRENLFGLDIDAEAVRVCAAVLAAKVQRSAPGARLQLNLVCSALAPPAAGSLRALAAAIKMDVAAARQAWRWAGLCGSLLRSSSGPPPLLEALFAVSQTDDLGIVGAAAGPAGARLRRIVAGAPFDVVVFNPPYLATSKIDVPQAQATFGAAPDLFAAFVERALESCKPDGYIAFVALANWMFLQSFQPTRRRLLQGSVTLIADIGKGAFRHASKLIQSAMVVAQPCRREGKALGARVGSHDEVSSAATWRIANELAEPGRYHAFDPALCAAIDGAPLLFWLDAALLQNYASLPKMDEVADGRGGIATGNNERFLRAVWEVAPEHTQAAQRGEGELVPYVKGADGREWLEPLRWLLRAPERGLELRLSSPALALERAAELGVAYTTIGHRFAARLHTVTSVRDVSGASMFPREASAAELLCALNRQSVRDLAAALNPTVNFQLGDVRRLPFVAVEGADEIVARLREAFCEHERGNELSFEYRGPRPSRWASARAWAQRAVDRPHGAALPPREWSAEPPSVWQRLSHALGVALGRFTNRAGELETGPEYLLLAAADDDLQQPRCAELRETWAEAGQSGALGDWLRHHAFGHHRATYDGRPVYWPLSSTRRNLVAWVSWHRLHDGTLASIAARVAAIDVERAVRAERDAFVATLRTLAERGPSAPDAETPAREIDAPFRVERDDGVRVHAAALWPLLDPQWKDPRKIWRELARGDGKRHWDWSRTAARYFPARVQQRCVRDASIAAAQGHFPALHPELAAHWAHKLGAQRSPRRR